MREALDNTYGADPTEAEASLIRDLASTAWELAHGVKSPDDVVLNHKPQTPAATTQAATPAAPSSATTPRAPRQLRESPRRVYEIDLEMDRDAGPEME